DGLLLFLGEAPRSRLEPLTNGPAFRVRRGELVDEIVLNHVYRLRRANAPRLHRRKVVAPGLGRQQSRFAAGKQVVESDVRPRLARKGSGRVQTLAAMMVHQDVRRG